MSLGYTGYLQPALPAIRSLLDHGFTYRNVAEAMHDAGYDQPSLALIKYIDNRYLRPGQLRQPRPTFERNRAIAREHANGETYAAIARKHGLSRERIRGVVAKSNRDADRDLKRRTLKAAYRHLRPLVRGRPIDMGGPRDRWLVWTPEMQSREFGLS